MNPVTFNDKFLDFLNSSTADVDYCRRAVSRVKKAPLILCSATHADFDDSSGVTRSLGKIPMAPFPDLRIHFEFTDTGEIVRVVRLDEGEIQGCKYVNLLISLTKKGGMPRYGDLFCFVTVKETTGMNLKVADSLFVLRRGELEKIEEDIGHDVASCGLLAIAKVASDFTNPNLYPVVVSKPPSDRSVEWVKQREHLIFVHKNSPINKVDASNKAFDLSKEIRRSAHSRRAHYRLLKSPRYKSKRGTLVLVRSCWVGPKEWEDASGQIYKIVDHPLNPDPKNALN